MGVKVAQRVSLLLHVSVGLICLPAILGGEILSFYLSNIPKPLQNPQTETQEALILPLVIEIYISL